MRMKNAEVESFLNFIMSMELSGKNSRLRTRFAKLLMQQQQLINEEHMELIKEYSHLDDNGNPKVKEENGKQMYDVYDRESFNKEYSILLNEDFIIEANEERREMLLLVKDVILNCEMTFKGREALQYDRWCEIVEDIDYEG